MKNYIGLNRDTLTVIEQKREKNRTFLLCKCCNCNKEYWIREDTFKNIKHCKCLNPTLFKSKDYTKIKKYSIAFLEPTDKKEDGHIIWKCKCSCGNIFYAIPSEIIKGSIKSCGCKKVTYTPDNLEKAINKHLKENIVEGTNLQVIKSNKLKKNNTSGYTGVIWDKARKKWVAQIKFKGKNIHLGRYNNIDDAIKARKEAEDKYFKPILEKYKEQD